MLIKVENWPVKTVNIPAKGDKPALTFYMQPALMVFPDTPPKTIKVKAPGPDGYKPGYYLASGDSYSVDRFEKPAMRKYLGELFPAEGFLKDLLK